MLPNAAVKQAALTSRSGDERARSTGAARKTACDVSINSLSCLSPLKKVILTELHLAEVMTVQHRHPPCITIITDIAAIVSLISVRAVAPGRQSLATLATGPARPATSFAALAARSPRATSGWLHLGGPISPLLDQVSDGSVKVERLPGDAGLTEQMTSSLLIPQHQISIVPANQNTSQTYKLAPKLSATDFTNFTNIQKLLYVTCSIALHGVRAMVVHDPGSEFGAPKM
jgi:hypothetical protein